MKPGDTVQVITKNGAVEGILLPSPELEKSVVILKLSSGYNIGIEKKNVKSTKLVAAAPAGKSSQKPSVAQKKNLLKISILHTGGTIASKVDYRTGGVIAGYSPEEMLHLFPELKDIVNVESRQIARVQSEMIRFPHYNIMAKEIEHEIKKGADGVIITHGTDTLHYSSAALAFALENLAVPVLLVGAQRSSDRGSSDAAMNLLNAVYFMANSDFAGVAICMHENMNDLNCLILPATKTRKMHTSRRDAFRPINATPIARVNYEAGKISFFHGNYDKKKSAAGKKLTLRLFNETLKIGMLKSHVNMFASELECYSTFDGLVLEGTGLGHVPNEEVDGFTAEHKKIFASLARIAQNIPVVMAPQTIYGRLQMNVYTPQRELLEIGVLGNFSDMTPETTFIKLAWLLSSCKKGEVKQLITRNFRGEITERTEPNAFLV